MAITLVIDLFFLDQVYTAFIITIIFFFILIWISKCIGEIKSKFKKKRIERRLSRKWESDQNEFERVRELKSLQERENRQKEISNEVDYRRQEPPKIGDQPIPIATVPKMVESISSGFNMHEQPVKLPKVITEEDSYRCSSSGVRYRRFSQTANKFTPESNNHALECNQFAAHKLSLEPQNNASEPHNYAPEPQTYAPEPVEADTGYMNAISGWQNSGERFISREIREQLEREEEMQHLNQQITLGTGADILVNSLNNMDVTTKPSTLSSSTNPTYNPRHTASIQTQTSLDISTFKTPSNTSSQHNSSPLEVTNESFEGSECGTCNSVVPAYCSHVSDDITSNIFTGLNETVVEREIRLSRECEEELARQHKALNTLKSFEESRAENLKMKSMKYVTFANCNGTEEDVSDGKVNPKVGFYGMEPEKEEATERDIHLISNGSRNMLPTSNASSQSILIIPNEKTLHVRPSPKLQPYNNQSRMHDPTAIEEKCATARTTDNPGKRGRSSYGTTESMIQRELREMREREEELRRRNTALGRGILQRQEETSHDDSTEGGAGFKPSYRTGALAQQWEKKFNA